MVDVSLRGFALRLTESLAEGSVQDFALTVGDGPEVVLRTRVVHSHHVLRGGDAWYLTGLEFLSEVTADPSASPMHLAS